ncbi:MAG TPA: PhnD/SsuA/transferrin family substrate-binding protein, partial [Acidiferrobacteraceae bacterium]|nr:PhnD/SsuA/transferrin family substrate-binding protein [Acidiferrobacteraceae bacterium]
DKAAVLQRAVVVRAGVPLATLRAHYLGHYDNIETGVALGDFAGGILKDTLAASARRKGVCIIYRSPWMPGYVFAARRGLSTSTEAAVRKAFLALRTGPAGAPAPLRALDPEYTGFAPIHDRAYAIIRQLIRPWWATVGLRPQTR